MRHIHCTLQEDDIGDQLELSKCFDLVQNYSLLFKPEKALPWNQVSSNLPLLKSTSVINAVKLS
jgi:hypothetical protein